MGSSHPVVQHAHAVGPMVAIHIMLGLMATTLSKGSGNPSNALVDARAYLLYPHVFINRIHATDVVELILPS